MAWRLVPTEVAAALSWSESTPLVTSARDLGIGFEAVEDVGAGLETSGVDEGLDGVGVPGFVGVVFGHGGGGLLLVVEADGGPVGVFGVVDDEAGGAGEVCGVASERS